MSEQEESNEEWYTLHCGYYEINKAGDVRRAKPGQGTYEGRTLIQWTKHPYDDDTDKGLLFITLYAHDTECGKRQVDIDTLMIEAFGDVSTLNQRSIRR